MALKLLFIGILCALLSLVTSIALHLTGQEACIALMIIVLMYMALFQWKIRDITITRIIIVGLAILIALTCYNEKELFNRLMLDGSSLVVGIVIYIFAQLSNIEQWVCTPFAPWWERE